MAEIYAMFAFEVGFAIDLDKAERHLQGVRERKTFRHRGRATSVFQLRPAPLRVVQDGAAIAVDQWVSEPAVELVLYDFGAASVTYRLPVPGGLDQLRDASVALRRAGPLRQDSRSRVSALLSMLGGAVQKPRVADLSEDYTILGMRELPAGQSAAVFCTQHAEAITQLLRPDSGGVSPEEIENATEIRISFGPTDMTIVDWDAAFVLDPDPEDVRAVLEFANVQLLEMRWLDQQLDAAIERSHQLLAPRAHLRAFLPRAGDDVRQVAGLQLESAVLLERVSNALKVFGEEYLTRIYRLAARRFQLAELDAAITSKLATVESIYQKLSDRAATIRMETLEWVVIILIAFEIVITLTGH